MVPRIFLLAAAGLVFGLITTREFCAEGLHIAGKGTAPLPVSVSPGAPESLKNLGRELANDLSRIAGVPFEAVSKRPGHAIVLGLRTEFPKILSGPEKREAPTWKERYRLVTQDGNLYIVGETDIAIEHGVFDLLHELGYRQYYPSKGWEIVPHRPELDLTIDRTEEPAYATRWIFLINPKDDALDEALGMKAVQAGFNAWSRKNRGDSTFRIRTGHAWLGMIRRNRQEFEAHPEWLSPESEDWRKPETDKNVKFAVEHDDLRELLKKDAIVWLKENPGVDTYSVEPSDGGASGKEVVLTTSSPKNRT